MDRNIYKPTWGQILDHPLYDICFFLFFIRIHFIIQEYIYMLRGEIKDLISYLLGSTVLLYNRGVVLK